MTSQAADVESPTLILPRKRGPASDFVLRLFRDKPLGALGGAIFLIMLLTGVFADVLAPFGYNEINPGASLEPSSATYLLGTDNLGRCLLSRIIYGARLSMIVGFAATAFSILISLLIGMTTGYWGGKFDLVVQRFVDGWMCFPALVILIVAVSILGPGMWQVIFILGLQFGVAGSRIVRGATVSIKENMYVRAADAIGASTLRILLRHILPNIMAPVIILFTARLAAVILAEATLSFLGLGIPPPEPSWGGMLARSGREYMLLAPRMAFLPGLALTVAVFGISVFGDAIRDLLDPKLRGGVGSYGGRKKRFFSWVRKRRVAEQ